jgi:hypothetical protein
MAVTIELRMLGTRGYCLRKSMRCSWIRAALGSGLGPVRNTSGW